MCNTNVLRSAFALTAGCAISVSAYPFFGLGDSIGLENPNSAPLLLSAVNNSTANTLADCGDGTACNSSTRTAAYPLEVKGAEIGLGGLAALLVIATYGLLMVYSPRLVTGLCFPSKTLSANIQTILERGWPREFDWMPESNPYLVYIDDGFSELRTDEGGQLGFYDLAKDGSEVRQKLQADPPNPSETIKTYKKSGNLLRGFEEISNAQVRQNASEGLRSTIWVQTASSAMKNVIQLGIWEWISFWLVLIMLFNTLLFNGIIGNSSPTKDRYPRLALVLIYLFLYSIHFVSTWYFVLKVYTLVILQASWAVVFRLPFALAANFDAAFPWMRQNDFKDELKVTFDRFDIDVLGSVAISERYGNVYTNGELEVYTPKLRYLSSSDYIEKIETFAAKVKARRIFCRMEKVPDEAQLDKLQAMQDAEAEAFEKATESALERVIVNTGVVLSICIATTFATWTQIRLPDATSRQIGSFALLASLSTAVTSLFASASQLNGMLNSAKEILRLTEVAISQLTTVRPNRTFFSHQQPLFGFAKQVKKPHRYPRQSISLGTVWGVNPSFYVMVLSIFFGPLVALLPSRRDYGQPPKLKLQVHDRSFIYWYPHEPQVNDFWHTWLSSQPALWALTKSTFELEDGYDEVLRQKPSTLPDNVTIFHTDAAGY
jgi:hypothetical protein